MGSVASRTGSDGVGMLEQEWSRESVTLASPVSLVEEVPPHPKLPTNLWLICSLIQKFQNWSSSQGDPACQPGSDLVNSTASLAEASLGQSKRLELLRIVLERAGPSEWDHQVTEMMKLIK